MSPRRKSISQRIQDRSHEEPAPDWLPEDLGPCRIWDGPTSGDGRGGGYPRMCLDGATVAVHRTSWVCEHGPIPPKKQLDHLCRRRLCISERHLEMVTHRENQRRRDREMKNSQATAPAVPKRKETRHDHPHTA